MRRKITRRQVLLQLMSSTFGSAMMLPVAAYGEGGIQEAEDITGNTDNLLRALRQAAEPLPPITDENFAAFADRFADARVVLLGEESHGTDEFYRARSAITQRLVRQHGFTVVALEADWPDAARMDAYVRGHSELPSLPSPLVRFPAWMWRNRVVMQFLEELKEINGSFGDPQRQAGIYGLDLYSLPSSMDAVVGFLDRVDANAAAEARERYGCLAPWVEQPETYGAMATGERIDTCSEDVISVIGNLLGQRFDHLKANDLAYFHALQNARVVAAAESYYRAMYEGSVESWNLRDTHMFETLEAVLATRGDNAKAVVWAHHSHIGKAAATRMGRSGEINIGQLAKEHFGEGAVSIGFGTGKGTVTAAHEWNMPGTTVEVREPIEGSYGALMQEAGHERFLLDFRNAGQDVQDAFSEERLERFIGVIYRPETELWSHYAEAALAQQFDAFIWLDTTKAVEPVPLSELQDLAIGHPLSAAQP